LIVKTGNSAYTDSGPGVGGLFSSTQLMMITTTAAASLSTSQALGGLQGDARANALFRRALKSRGYGTGTGAITWQGDILWSVQ
jgi:hypothetical protein